MLYVQSSIFNVKITDRKDVASACCST